MTLFGMKVIEHPSIPEDEAWIIKGREIEQLPYDLKGEISAPCIVTGNLTHLKQASILTQLRNLDA